MDDRNIPYNSIPMDTPFIEATTALIAPQIIKPIKNKIARDDLIAILLHVTKDNTNNKNHTSYLFNGVALNNGLYKRQIAESNKKVTDRR